MSQTEKFWKFVTYVPGSGAECISGNEEYISSGFTLKEAKAKLVEEIGCTKDFFDNPAYTKITRCCKPNA